MLQVGSVIYNYYELRKIKPRLKKLYNLLAENPYRGKECEGDELDTGSKVLIILSPPKKKTSFWEKVLG